MADDPGKLLFWKPDEGAGKLVLGEAPDAGGQTCTVLAGRLTFWKPAEGSGKLVFGDGICTGTPTTPDVTLEVDGDLPGLDGPVGLQSCVALSVDADFPAMESSVALAWDANAFRGLVNRAQPHFQQARPIASAARQHWQNSQRVSRAHRTRWQDGKPAGHTARARWQQSQPLRATARPRFQQGKPIGSDTRGRFQQSIALRSGARPAFQQGAPILAGGSFAFQQMLRLSNYSRLGFQQAQPIASIVHSWLRTGLPLWHLHRPGFQQAMHPLPGLTPPYVPAGPEKELCYDPAQLGKLVFERPYVGDGKLVFICHRAGGPVDPVDPVGAIVLPTRRYYMQVNEVDLRRVDGDLSLFALDLQMALDSGSWTWQWSATLARAAEGRLEALKAGEQVEVVATINGVAYRLLAEEMHRDRSQFPVERIKVAGRGLAAALDTPAAPLLNFTNTSQRSAEQLMLDALTLNGVPIGWDVDFGIEDWVVPAGAWVHRGSYISAVNAIANAAGAYVQPHPTARTLRILHRYPVAPWDWDWQTMSNVIVVPIAAAITEGVGWASKPAYNRVFVGGEAQGVLGQITRSGTAGDFAADPVVDPLITDATAARQRGRAELSDTGAQAIVTLGMQVRGDTGLILPGKFLRRTDGAEALQGYVRGVRVNWEGNTGALRQSVEVQTHA